MNTKLMPGYTDSYALYVGDLHATVGRPVVIVTYTDSSPTTSGSRREASTYWSFFSNAKPSFTSAVCQRLYFKDVHPRLGPETMLDRAADEAFAALIDWTREAYDLAPHAAPAGLKQVDLDTLFGLFSFSEVVRECITYVARHIDNDTLAATFQRWNDKYAVDTVRLRVPLDQDREPRSPRPRTRSAS